VPGITLFNKVRARRLHAQAQAFDQAGESEAALAKYAEALVLNPDRPDTLYNIGLIHKYRRAWPESFEFNRRARELRPDDEATNWNLAIAATALRDWRTARGVWNGLGMNVELGDAPIESNFGVTPVRLNPDDDGEVVWARRIDPVRARIENIPLPTSGFRWCDIVLHDGAPVGYRRDEKGKERAVFNVLELFTASPYSTFEIELVAPTPEDVEALEALCEPIDVQCEDWTQNIRHLCRACSQGRPHEHHDTDGGNTEWTPERHVGISALTPDTVEELLSRWASGPRQILAQRLALEAGPMNATAGG
jgi:hypothetical protein